MEHISAHLPAFPPAIQNEIDQYMAMSLEQRLERDCKAMNEQGPGEQRGKEDIVSCYDCPTCHNKTKIYEIYNGEIVFHNCHCLSIRTSILRARASGLGEELKRCQFSSFIAETDVQRDVKARAKAYAENPAGWLIISGQVGSGKTHICTAVTGKLIHSGKSARYMRWKDESTELKGKINDPEYRNLIGPLLSVDVLYIDDFLKTPRGDDGVASLPRSGDLYLAFEIISNRYSSGKITIISSEHTVSDIIRYDEAVGSRIYERAKDGDNIIISAGIENNYRLKGAV